MSSIRLAGVTGDQRRDDVHDRVDRLLRLPEEADEGHQGDQGGEDRQHRVVGECRREVGAAVVEELAHGPAEHEERGPLRPRLVVLRFSNPISGSSGPVCSGGTPSIVRHQRPASRPGRRRRVSAWRTPPA